MGLAVSVEFPESPSQHDNSSGWAWKEGGQRVIQLRNNGHRRGRRAQGSGAGVADRELIDQREVTLLHTSWDLTKDGDGLVSGQSSNITM
jgi:hypothetical protein